MYARRLSSNSIDHLRIELGSLLDPRAIYDMGVIRGKHKRNEEVKRKVVLLSTTLLFGIAGIAAKAQKTDSLDEIRHVANLIPGKRPLRINVLKFAESRRHHHLGGHGRRVSLLRIRREPAPPLPLAAQEVANGETREARRPR